MEVSFRAVATDDFDFLWRLHNAAFKKYIEETWGWDEEWQQRNFREIFEPSVGQIIEVGGMDAG